MSNQHELCFQAPLDLTWDDRRVLEVLREAAGRPVPRAVLCGRLGLHDRELRHVVKALVEVYNQPIIANYGPGGGYAWVPDDPAVRERCEQTYRGQALSLMGRAAKLRRMNLLEYMKQFPLEVTR